VTARRRSWADARIYQVYVRSFQDSDGDGLGDLDGVTARLDHLAGLGVDALWLSPIHPSPDADLGYDVADHRAVDPRFGTFASFDRLVTEAHARGLGVILDWVVNHTSDRHPWFRAALADPGSPYRDWYLFRPGRGGGPPNNWTSRFGGGPAWARDPGSGEWYLHTFLAEQPDLNWRHPPVRDAVADAMRFWLDRGVDGFRLDALPLLMKDVELRDNPADRPAHTVDLPEMADVVRFLRGVVDEYDGRVLLGEMGLPPRLLARYHATIHLPMNFGLITRPWTAQRLRDRIASYLAALPADATPNWVLGNHDVSRVTTRLGPELARVAAVLQLTLPGAAVVYYGEELGLPDLPGPVDPARWRDPERAPMPWDDGPAAGFTSGTPWLPVLPDARRLSVAAQDADPRSVLNLYRALLRLRTGSGPIGDLAARDDVLSYRRDDLRVVANLGDAPARTVVDGEAPLLVASTVRPETSGGAELEVGPRDAVVLARAAG
jgi:alpha-glucosidase